MTLLRRTVSSLGPKRPPRSSDPTYENIVKEAPKAQPRKSLSFRSKDENDEDVITLLYSRHCGGALEWAKYLDKLYTELSKYKGSKLLVRHLPLEDLTDYLAYPVPSVEDSITRSSLTVILLSSGFLNFLRKNPLLLIGRYLNPERVLAIMLGIQDHQIDSGHRNSLLSYHQWIHLTAKDHDLEFVQTVFHISTQILQKVSGAPKSHPRCYESNLFSLFPKSVRADERHFLIIFDSPQRTEASLEVTYDNMEFKDASFVNSYTGKVRIPDYAFKLQSFESRLSVRVNGIDYGTRSLYLSSHNSEMEALLQRSMDPLVYLCQIYNICPPVKEELDTKLSKLFEESLKHFPKEFFPRLIHAKHEHEDGLEKFPTLLHFAAFIGLNKLTRVLVSTPGSLRFLSLRNNSGFTPSEMASLQGHHELADFLSPEMYHEYSELVSDYSIPPPPRPLDLSDRFGTLLGKCALVKGRPSSSLDSESKPDLIVMDELLNLLNNFQSKSYSLSEMETMFENWKKKAISVREMGKKKNSFLKLFKKKDEENSSSTSLVVQPPTPKVHSEVVSSQILPLQRISENSNHHHHETPIVPNNTLITTVSSSLLSGKNNNYSVSNEFKFSPESCEEPEVLLNTPKSLLSKNSTLERRKKNFKSLFSSTTTFVPSQKEEYVNLPSMIITDFD